MKTVCVVGLGYIGLPTAIVAAENKYNVIGFDIDEERVERINACDPIIEEPELVPRLTQVINNKTFKAATTMVSADYYIIAVPTPLSIHHGVDLSFVWSALNSIMLVIKKGQSIILESTVPVGTTEKLVQKLSKHFQWVVGTDFFVAHCPERVLPGNIFHELEHNDRIIGGTDKNSSEAITFFYRSFVKGNIFQKSARLAEMVKLIENSSRDVQIAFAHQVASMAEAAKLDPYEVIEMANKHPRVNVLNPTIGVGGHCIAIDPYFLVESFPQQTQLISVARQINNMRPQQVIDRIHHMLQEYNKPQNILIVGLTYKPNIDDVRESPALKIASKLEQTLHHNVFFAEPNLSVQQISHHLPKSKTVPLEAGIEKADVVVLLVAHNQIKAQHIIKQLSTKRILDFCGVWYQASKKVSLSTYYHLVSEKIMQQNSD